MKKILAILLVMSSTCVVASGEELQGWWDGEYKQTIEPQQKQAAEQIVEDRCVRRMKKYQVLVNDSPDDVYYAWKLKLWTKKCEESK